MPRLSVLPAQGARAAHAGVGEILLGGCSPDAFGSDASRAHQFDDQARAADDHLLDPPLPAERADDPIASIGDLATALVVSTAAESATGEGLVLVAPPQPCSPGR